MSKLNFTVSEEKCISCNACVKDCPRQIIKNADGKIPYIPSELEDDCLKCQHCLAICPTAAISILGIKPQECLPVGAEDLPKPEQLERLIRGRRSVRQFMPENVDSKLIEKMLNTVANAPSGCNVRGLRFTVLRDRAAMQALLEKIISTLEIMINDKRLETGSFLAGAVAEYRKSGNDAFFRGAPHALIISAGPSAMCPVEDVNIALSYFEILARAEGLGALWCGMLKFALDTAPELKELLSLNNDQYFYTVLFGVPAVHYKRTVKQDETAEIRMIAADEL